VNPIPNLSDPQTAWGRDYDFDERRAMASDQTVMSEYLALLPSVRPLYACLDQTPERAQLVELSGRLNADDPELALRQIVGLFTRELIASAIRPDLDRFADSPMFCPPTRTHESEKLSSFVLYEDERVAVSIFVVKRSEAGESAGDDASQWSRKGVPFDPFDRAVKILHGKDAALHIWRASAIGSDEAITREMSCSGPETITRSSGDVLFLRGGTETYTFGDRPTPLVLISASARTCRSPVVPQYNMASRRIAGVSAVDPAVSRMQLLSSVLRQLDPDRSIDALQPLLRHGAHFVRWHAMREMLCADAARAKPFLEKMAEGDTHPQVLAAARSALEMIQEQ